MVRNDFVSNSSSCSFVITNPSDIANKINLDFFNILAAIPYNIKKPDSCDNGCIRFYPKNEKFSDEILKFIEDANSSNYGYVFSVYNNDITLENPYILYKIPILIYKDSTMILKLFEESNHVEINLGLDDCDEKKFIAGGIANLLNYNYGALIDSEECNVDLVKETLQQLEENND